MTSESSIKTTLNLDTLPIEILTQIMLNLPYDDLVKMCNTNKLTNIICNDENFWANKAQLDFNVSTQEFFRLNSPKQLYLHLSKKFKEDNVIKNYLNEVFKLGMYGRGWKGPGSLYPVERSDQHNDPAVLISRAKLGEIYNDAPINIKEILKELQIMKYDITSGFIIHEDNRIYRLVGMINCRVSSAHWSSRTLIVSAVFHLERMYNVKIPDFDINTLKEVF